jgi:hypothetical protein
VVAPGTIIHLWQPDLSTWTTSSMPVENGISGTALFPIAFLNGRFLAAGPLPGRGPTITNHETSTDGLQWSEFQMTFSVTSGRSNTTGWSPTSYAYGNGQYLAGFGDGVIYHSTDAVSWTPIPAATNLSLTAAACGGTTCVFGAQGLIIASTSPQMQGWSLNYVQTPLGKVNFNASGMAYGSGLFVGVGMTQPGGGVATNAIITSPDGVNWKVAASPPDNLFAVTPTASGFVAVGSHGTYATSPDGVTWTNGTISLGNPLVGVACGPTACVAVEKFGGIYATPVNVMSWTRVSSVSGTLSGVAFGAGRFVAYGYLYATGALVALTSVSAIPPT